MANKNKRRLRDKAKGSFAGEAFEALTDPEKAKIARKRLRDIKRKKRG